MLIGADIITCSAYKFFGPHVGVTAIGDSGGFIRAGLAPYNTEDEVERFVQALEGIVRET